MGHVWLKRGTMQGIAPQNPQCCSVKQLRGFHKSRWFPKDAELFLYKKNQKRKGGLNRTMIEDLLSKIPSILHWVWHLWCFETKYVRVGLIVVSPVGTMIDMNQVSWNVETGGGILELMRMCPKDIPIILRDAIMCFASANGSKLNWPWM